MSVPRHWILGGWYSRGLMSTSRGIDGVIVIKKKLRDHISCAWSVQKRYQFEVKFGRNKIT